MVEVATGNELDVGQDIVDSEYGGVAWIAGPKVPAGWWRLDNLVSKDSEFGVLFDKVLWDFDNLNFRAGDFQIREDSLGDPFVDERADSLGIVGELYDVVVAV